MAAVQCEKYGRKKLMIGLQYIISFRKSKKKKKEKRKEELYKIDLTDNFTPITDNGFSKTVN